MIRAFLIALSFLLLLSGQPVRADTDNIVELVEKGLSAYSSGNYEAARRYWQEAAESGSPAAQNNLGVLYLEGLGVDRDLTKGLALITKAADFGYLHALYNLGLHYQSGQGLPQSDRKAVLFFARAAGQGHLEAIRELGLAFRDGVGIQSDSTLAYRWLALAGLHGEKRARLESQALATTMSAKELAAAAAVVKARKGAAAVCKKSRNTPTPERSDAINMQGFWFFSPPGGGWCLRKPNFFRSSAVLSEVAVGGTLYDIDQPPERTHTLIAEASRVDVDGPMPRTDLELMRLVREWASLGFPSMTQWSGKTRLMTHRGIRPEDMRQHPVSNSAAVERLNGMDCVRFKATSEESGNTYFPGKALTLNVMGYLCLPSQTATDLLEITVSERFPKDEVPTSSIFDKRNIEYEVFLRGLHLYWH